MIVDVFFLVIENEIVDVGTWYLKKKGYKRCKEKRVI